MSHPALTEGRTEYMVRTLNEYENLQQMEDTIVATSEGRQIRVRDLGRLEWSHKERQITTLLARIAALERGAQATAKPEIH